MVRSFSAWEFADGWLTFALQPLIKIEVVIKSKARYLLISEEKENGCKIYPP